MDENLKKQQELYDRGWRTELQAGKEERGNLQTNLEFLDQTNLLKPQDKILEIGCGIGTGAYLMSKHSVKTIAIDNNTGIINKAKSTNGKLIFNIISLE